MEQTILLHTLKLHSNLLRIPFYLHNGHCITHKIEPYPSPYPLIEAWSSELIQSPDTISYLLTKDLLLVGCVSIVDTPQHILVGPVRVGAMSDTTLHNINLALHNLRPIDDLSQAIAFFNACNPYSLEQFLPILCTLHGFINHLIIMPESLSQQIVSFPDLVATHTHLLSNEQNHVYEDKRMHNNISLEEELLYYISHGMTKELRQMNLLNHKMGVLATDSLRHYKNACIILNTLSQRAAIKGGLPPEIAYQLGEIYIQRIEACKSLEMLFHISPNIPVDYCERVALIKFTPTNHKKIDATIRYVQENYHKKLSIPEIAEAVGLSSEYLSSKFIQVVGSSLPSYIKEQKIAKAKQLLQFTEMTLSEITEYLSFSSQSYFQTVFKQITGITPLEYRQQNALNF